VIAIRIAGRIHSRPATRVDVRSSRRATSATMTIDPRLEISALLSCVSRFLSALR
jgi:hypothetical protein